MYLLFVVDFWIYGLMEEETNSVFVSKKAEWLEQENNLHIKVTAKTHATG